MKLTIAHTLFTLVAATAFSHAWADDQGDLVKKGQYIAVAGDCIACHTAKNGQSFAGGYAINSPLGTIYSSNITPSKTAGIGNYTEAQFAKAVREGVRADGANLYPAMPYTAYAKISDDDMKALYAYFMHGVKAVDTPAPKTALPFPFNIRMSLSFWNALYLDKKTFQPDASKSDEINRGAYLIQGLAHCSTCHTPRNAMMAEEQDQFLGGASLGTWYAPNITSDVNSGIGSWSTDEIVQYLKTGFAPGKAQAAGPMAEAIDHSFSHMSDSDLQAMAAWLKQSQPIHQTADTKPAWQHGQAAGDEITLRNTPLSKDANQWTGAQIYDASCASCHQDKAQGEPDRGLPSLFHNTALGHQNTDNLVMTILDGVARTDESGYTNMPGFSKHLNDQQIVTLSNYLLTTYGNPDAKVTLDQVKTLRAGGPKSSLGAIAQYGMIAGVIIVLLIIGFIFRCVSRRKNKQ